MSPVSRRALLSSAAAVGVAAVLYPGRAAAVSPTPALFVAAHPDDETLAMGAAIVAHVAAGQDVHVLVLTDGDASGVRPVLNGASVNPWWGVQHDPAAEGYAPLDGLAFAAARVRELETAARAMATGLPGTLTVHRAGLGDQTLTQASASAAVLAVCDAIDPGGAGVRLKSHTHVAALDANPDHVAIGGAVRQLAVDYPARFGSAVGGPRYYILPGYWSDPDLSLVGERWDVPADAGAVARVRNAARAYAAWAPEQGRFAVGWHSTTSWFEALTAAPKSMYHK